MIDRRRRLFVEGLVQGLSGAEAVRKAGFSKRYACRKAYLLKQEPAVQTLLHEMKKELNQRALVDAEAVLREVEKIALDPATAARDKLRALDLLGRHLNLWKAPEAEMHAQAVINLTIAADPGTLGDKAMIADPVQEIETD